MKNKVFTIKLTEIERNRLAAIAEREGRTKSNWLRKLINDYPLGLNEESKGCQKVG